MPSSIFLLVLNTNNQGDQIKQGKNDKQWRKIFQDGTPYDQFQDTNINKLNQYLKQKNISISQWFDLPNKLRFLQANKFKIQQTCTSIKQASKWRKQYFPLLPNPQLNKILNDGSMYFLGRDRSYRPILITQITRMKKYSQDTIQGLLNNLLEYCLDHLLIQGQVQNYILIINLNDAGLSDRNAVIKIVSFTSNTYRSRLYASYLVNTPLLIASGWNTLASQFVSENTLKKIKISRASIHEDMWKHIDRQIVEQKYGGLLPNKRCSYWPPEAKQMNYISKLTQNKLITKEQYNKRYRTGKLTNRKIKQSLIQKQTTDESQHELITPNKQKQKQKQKEKEKEKEKEQKKSQTPKIQKKYQVIPYPEQKNSAINLLPVSKIKKEIFVPMQKRQFKLFFQDQKFISIFK